MASWCKVGATEVDAEKLTALNGQQVRDTLQKSGLWVGFRGRPYGKVPAIDAVPHSIFVNAMDSNPLAADPQLVIEQNANAFAAGVAILDKFEVPVFQLMH